MPFCFIFSALCLNIANKRQLYRCFSNHVIQLIRLSAFCGRIRCLWLTVYSSISGSETRPDSAVPSQLYPPPSGAMQCKARRYISSDFRGEIVRCALGCAEHAQVLLSLREYRLNKRYFLWNSHPLSNRCHCFAA